MAAAIWVRTDHTSEDLRRFARRCGDPDQVRRLLAIALILDDGSRSDSVKVAGVTVQIVRDWVLRFNADGPDGLAARKAPGRASILNDEQRARLAEVVETGAIPAAHGVVRWRLADVAQWVWDEFSVSVTRHRGSTSCYHTLSWAENTALMSAFNAQGARHYPSAEERCQCIRAQVEVGPERRR